MNRVWVGGRAVLVIIAALTAAPWLQAQQNGEARSSVPDVVRTVYDMRTFMAPLPLTEAELRGRRHVARRCANCHGGGTRQAPGPVLSRETVERLGESTIRDKVSRGSLAMPGFEYTLQPGQIDEIVAFLKTAAPGGPQAGAPAAPE